MQMCEDDILLGITVIYILMTGYVLTPQSCIKAAAYLLSRLLNAALSTAEVIYMHIHIERLDMFPFKVQLFQGYKS
jgi:hypothetical protein